MARQQRRQGRLRRQFSPRGWKGDLARARTVFMEALKRVDIALPTYDDEAVLWGDPSPESTVARLQAFGVGEIVVKNGPNSALVAAFGALQFVPVPEILAPSIRRRQAMDLMPVILPPGSAAASPNKRQAPRIGSLPMCCAIPAHSCRAAPPPSIEQGLGIESRRHWLPSFICNGKNPIEASLAGSGIRAMKGNTGIQRVNGRLRPHRRKRL